MVDILAVVFQHQKTCYHCSKPAGNYDNCSVIAEIFDNLMKSMDTSNFVEGNSYYLHYLAYWQLSNQACSKTVLMVRVDKYIVANLCILQQAVFLDSNMEVLELSFFIQFLVFYYEQWYATMLEPYLHSSHIMYIDEVQNI